MHGADHYAVIAGFWIAFKWQAAHQCHVANNGRHDDGRLQTLPNATAVWDLIRRCFDIRHKDLEETSAKDLQRFAEQQRISQERTQAIQGKLQQFLWDKRLRG